MSAPIFNIVPNVIVPNDFNLPNTLTPYQCTMAIGINDVGYGTTEETGFVNGFTPPSGGWTIYYTNSSNILFTQVANSIEDLLRITNYLSGTNYTDVTSAIIWYYGDTNQLGGSQILANYDLPNFVTSVSSYSDLALCFLSGYSMSFDYNLFSGGFNNWIDLAQSNFIAINGAFAISGSGAQTSLLFDGSTTYGMIMYSGENFVPLGNAPYTISIWFNVSNTAGRGQYGLFNYGNTDTNYNANNIYFNLAGDASSITNGWGGDDLSSPPFTLNQNSWYNVTCTFDGTFRKIYLNGSQVAQDNPSTHTVTDSTNLTIGNSFANGYTTVNFFNGLMQNVNVYQVCLTPQQILQNYYALQTIIF